MLGGRGDKRQTMITIMSRMKADVAKWQEGKVKCEELSPGIQMKASLLGTLRLAMRLS